MRGMRREKGHENNMTFSYKIFTQGEDTLMAVSDSEILGRIFEEGEFHINVSREFYSGKTAEEKEILAKIKKATIVNVVGKRIVDLMVKEKIIESGNILVISGVPHAQVILV